MASTISGPVDLCPSHQNKMLKAKNVSDILLDLSSKKHTQLESGTRLPTKVYYGYNGLQCNLHPGIHYLGSKNHKMFLKNRVIMLQAYYSTEKG